MEDWKEYKLGELCIGKGSYGIAASAVPFSPTLHTYLRITDINDDGTLNKVGLMSVDEDDADKYLLKPNDIVFARTGNSTGRSYFYDGSDGVLVYAGFLIKFSLNCAKVNPRILKYYTHSKPYYDWVKSFGTGSTRGNINAKTYGNMPITLPPRDIQDKIVDILKSFDDKIEVNRRINDNFYFAFFEVMLIWLLTSFRNDNLEQQAQALFKSWFVDFEPFKNCEFVESELGRIPKGWKVGILSELIDVKYGKDHKKLSDGIIPVYGSGGLMRMVEKELYEGESVLIPRKGTLNNVMYVNEKFWTVDTMFYSIPKVDNIILITYLFLSNKDLASLNTGSAVPSMTTEILNNLKIVMPSQDVIDKFNSIMYILYSKIKYNQQESRRLASLRDTLLPRLLSGELIVNDIEQ